MTDWHTISAPDMGRQLRGIGLNLLVRDVANSVRFVEHVFSAEVFQPSPDFAIVKTSGGILQLHADHAYHSNDLLSLVPESGPRGGGLEIRLYDSDPDQAVNQATSAGYQVLAQALDKPHGLREAYIMDPDGYAWVPSCPLKVAD